MAEITFRVNGTPAGKGSMVSFMNPRTGKTVSKHDSKILALWTRLLKFNAVRAAREVKLAGPTPADVCVYISIWMERPASHFRVANGRPSNVLRPDARPRPTGKKADVDKLARACLDAMSGVIYVDDCQVYSLQIIKAYTCETYRLPGAVVTVIW